MASVEIDKPLRLGSLQKLGGTVYGSFSADSPVFTITCTLKKSGFPDLSALVVPNTATRKWTAGFPSIPTSGNKHTLVAHITGTLPDDDEQQDITVVETPVIDLGEFPPIPSPPLPRGIPVPFVIDGKFTAGAEIFCVAAVTRKYDLSIVTVARAALDVPQPGMWRATLMVPPVPEGKKLAVLAMVMDANGAVIGRAYARSD